MIEREKYSCMNARDTSLVLVAYRAFDYSEDRNVDRSFRIGCNRLIVTRKVSFLIPSSLMWSWVLSHRRSDQFLCFLLIPVTNWSTWIDLFDALAETPLMVPMTPKGWTSPSIIAVCMSAENILSAIQLVLIYYLYQERPFPENPFICLIMIVGIVSCSTLTIFWQNTTSNGDREPRI